eukprot:Platyproteum_vivax@DN4863_c0_g1_i1.p1
MHDIVDKILCFCATMDSLPSIRFQDNNLGICKQVATFANSRLSDAFLKIRKNKTRDSSVLLIVDRSVDLSPLFLHEYTFRAMAYDMLPITDDQFSYDVTNNLGVTEPKVALLNENDELWARFRHMHLSLVNDAVAEEVQEFAKSHAAHVQRGENTTSADTAAALKQLPHYQEMLSKYWVHSSISEALFAEMSKADLVRIGSLEQDIVCGVDRDGSNVTATKLLTTLGTYLSDPAPSSEVKMRLFLIALTMIDGLSDDDKKQMLDLCRFDARSKDTIAKFLEMNLIGLLGGAERTGFLKGGKGNSGPSLRLSKDKQKYFKQRAKQVKFELSRYEPVLKDVMKKAVKDTLDSNAFPFLEAPSRSNASKTPTANTTAPAGGLWDWTSNHKVAAPKSTAKGPQLFVFVVGGVSCSEMRAVYEVNSENSAADVYLGSTSILTPKAYLHLLHEQSEPPAPVAAESASGGTTAKKGFKNPFK